MFQDQLAELIEHLVERLFSDDGGRQKTFRDSTITNLDEFFSRFRQLSVGSSEELSDLVDKAQSVMHGVEPQSLRDSDTLRQRIATQMSAVQASLDGRSPTPKHSSKGEVTCAIECRTLGQRSLHLRRNDSTSATRQYQDPPWITCEPVSGGKWIADMKPVDGPVLGPFSMRTQALAAERRWFEKKRLPKG